MATVGLFGCTTGADAVITTDPTGRVTYLNPTAERLTGWSLHESVGRAWDQVFRLAHVASGVPVGDLVPRALTEGAALPPGAAVDLNPRTGPSVPVDPMVSPIRDDAGQVMGCVIVFRDASERRKTEQTMLTQNEELNHPVPERTAGLPSANAQRLVTLHGGRVRAEGRSEQGPAFHFALPLWRPEVSPSSERFRPGHPADPLARPGLAPENPPPTRDSETPGTDSERR